MKKRLLSIMLCAIVLIGTYAAGIIMPVSAVTVSNDSEKIYCNATIDDDFAPDSVLVVLNTLTSLKFQTYSAEDFSEIKAKNVSHITAYSESVVQKVLNSAETSAAFESTMVEVEPVDLSTYRQVLYVELEDTGKDKVLEAIQELEKREDILYVGPDYYLEPCSDTSTQTYEAYFADQWAYDTIELGKALDEIDTSSEVLVGIMDSGIDGDHPDLEARIDTLLSCDFAYLYGNTDGQNNDLDYDPLEDDDNHKNHGTKVAGIIAGICENAKLVSLKIMEGVTLSSGDGGGAKYRSSYACRAIEYAERNNIKILCMSVGWAGSSASGEFDNSGYDEAMCSIIDQYSGLLICAAGNNNRNIDDNNADWDIYPQQYDLDQLLVVSASTQYDTIETNSNWGSDSVDIFAPGKNICTTVKGGGRGTMSDTSAASPVVAGVAAILLSIDPTLSNNMIWVKEYIMGNADDVTAFVGKCESGGRLNAYKAVSAVLDDIGNNNETCQHYNTYYDYNSSTHTVICSSCEEEILTESHNYYMVAIYDGDNGCTVGCLDCSYRFDCSCNPEYGSGGSEGHYVSCPDGEFAFFEEHAPAMHKFAVDANHHTALCLVCASSYLENHTWEWDAYSMLYVCTECGYTSSYAPGIMSLPAPEFEAYLASLSEEELDLFLASLPEDQAARVTALLPGDDENLTE